MFQSWSSQSIFCVGGRISKVSKGSDHFFQVVTSSKTSKPPPPAAHEEDIPLRCLCQNTQIAFPMTPFSVEFIGWLSAGRMRLVKDASFRCVFTSSPEGDGVFQSPAPCLLRAFGRPACMYRCVKFCCWLSSFQFGCGFFSLHQGMVVCAEVQPYSCPISQDSAPVRTCTCTSAGLSSFFFPVSLLLC